MQLSSGHHPVWLVRSTHANKFATPNASNSTSIKKFIQLCKEHEDQNGDITNSFFNKIISNEGKFINGPFSNYFFNLIKKDKTKVSVLVGKMSISISNDSKILYQPA